MSCATRSVGRKSSRLWARQTCLSVTSNSKSRSNGSPAIWRSGTTFSTASCTRSPLPIMKMELNLSTRRRSGLSCGRLTSHAFAGVSRECGEGLARAGRVGGDDLDLDHHDGQRELRLHGSDQGGARFVAGVFGQIVQPVLAGAVQ